MSTETIPANVIPEGTPEAPPDPASVPQGTPDFAIPDQYKEKDWAKGLDSYDKAFEMLDGAQSLVGKRPAGIPEDTASEEDWNNFYKEMGRPEAADKYEFEAQEFPEGITPDEEFLGNAKETFHKLGLSQKQAAGLKKWFDEYTIGLHGKQQEIVANQDKDFDALADQTFGKDKDVIFDNARKLLQDNVPESFKDKLDNISNDNLIIMAGVLNNIQNKYISEDRLPGKGEGVPILNTEEDLRNEGRKLMMHPAFANSFHPEHADIIAKKDAVYAKIRKLQKP